MSSAPTVLAVGQFFFQPKRKGVTKVCNYGFFKDKRRNGYSGDFKFLNSDEFVLVGESKFFVGDFLHGWCDAFAFLLHDEFGWDVEEIVDEGGLLVHAYCVRYDDGVPVFIDVRGETTNFYDFVYEFWDCLPIDFPANEYCPDAVVRMNECDIKKQLRLYDQRTLADVNVAAEKIIKKYGFWK